MNARHLRWIAIAVVALLVLWAGGRLLPSGTDQTAPGFALPAIAADSADTIAVAAADDTILLARAGAQQWTANGFAASSTAVAEFFTALGEGAAPELVARSASSFARLGVDSAAARRVRVVHADQVLLDVLVSEKGPDVSGVYLRRPGDSSVYAVVGRLGAITKRRLPDWRDKTVATVVPDSVDRIELRRGRRRTLLRRDAPGWRLAGGTPADTTAVRRLLERYRHVTATGFPTAAQRDSTFRGPVERSVALRDGSGTALVELEFDSMPGGFWVRRTGAVDGPVFRVSHWLVDALVPADSTLR